MSHRQESFAFDDILFYGMCHCVHTWCTFTLLYYLLKMKFLVYDILSKVIKMNYGIDLMPHSSRASHIFHSLSLSSKFFGSIFSHIKLCHFHGIVQLLLLLLLPFQRVRYFREHFHNEVQNRNPNCNVQAIKRQIKGK